MKYASEPTNQCNTKHVSSKDRANVPLGKNAKHSTDLLIKHKMFLVTYILPHWKPILDFATHTCGLRNMHVTKCFLTTNLFSLVSFVATTPYNRNAIINIIYLSIHVLQHRICYEERWLSNAPRALCFQCRFISKRQPHLYPHDDGLQPRARSQKPAASTQQPTAST